MGTCWKSGVSQRDEERGSEREKKERVARGGGVCHAVSPPRATDSLYWSSLMKSETNDLYWRGSRRNREKGRQIAVLHFFGDQAPPHPPPANGYEWIIMGTRNVLPSATVALSLVDENALTKTLEFDHSIKDVMEGEVNVNRGWVSFRFNMVIFNGSYRFNSWTAWVFYHLDCHMIWRYTLTPRTSGCKHLLKTPK